MLCASFAGSTFAKRSDPSCDGSVEKQFSRAIPIVLAETSSLSECATLSFANSKASATLGRMHNWASSLARQAHEILELMVIVPPRGQSAED